ncbi:hypothetical protein KGV52_01425 [Candidatus Gracilibacteria bacterium]|nr:hypothetical protein [Candidatus Gracilibacteria bacterium]
MSTPEQFQNQENLANNSEIYQKNIQELINFCKNTEVPDKLLQKIDAIIA